MSMYIMKWDGFHSVVQSMLHPENPLYSILAENGFRQNGDVNRNRNSPPCVVFVKYPLHSSFNGYPRMMKLSLPFNILQYSPLRLAASLRPDRRLQAGLELRVRWKAAHGRFRWGSFFLNFWNARVEMRWACPWCYIWICWNNNQRFLVKECYKNRTNENYGDDCVKADLIKTEKLSFSVRHKHIQGLVRGNTTISKWKFSKYKFS